MNEGHHVAVFFFPPRFVSLLFAPALPSHCLQWLCELAVQKGITTDNSAALLHTSDDLRASRLRDICMRFVVRHFDTVSKSEVTLGTGAWLESAVRFCVRTHVLPEKRTDVFSAATRALGELCISTLNTDVLRAKIAYVYYDITTYPTIEVALIG